MHGTGRVNVILLKLLYQTLQNHRFTTRLLQEKSNKTLLLNSPIHTYFLRFSLFQTFTWLSISEWLKFEFVGQRLYYVFSPIPVRLCYWQILFSHFLTVYGQYTEISHKNESLKVVWKRRREHLSLVWQKKGCDRPNLFDGIRNVTGKLIFIKCNLLLPMKQGKRRA